MIWAQARKMHIASVAQSTIIEIIFLKIVISDDYRQSAKKSPAKYACFVHIFKTAVIQDFSILKINLDYLSSL